MLTLERDRELDVIAAALDAAADERGALVVIEGAPGIGKTRLVADARSLADIRRFRVLAAAADELERALAWGIVRQLFEREVARADASARSELLAGRVGAALAALECSPEHAGGSDASLARTLHALWWAAAEIAARRPALIALDDAQWADAPSLRFLVHLARRIEDLPIALVVATRPVTQPTGPLAELAAGRLGERLVPGPLSVDAIAELAAERGVPIAAEVVAAVHGASGGNPFLADQLLDELDTRALSPADPATAAVVAGLGPLTISRALLARLPLDAIQLAAAVAVLGSPRDPQLAGTLARIDSQRLPGAIDALVTGHVLAPIRDELRFVHPVVREAVLAELAPGERAALHAAAAVQLQVRGAAADRVAAHLAAAPPGTLPDAAELLRKTAAKLRADGDPATAARFLRRALDEAPRDDAIAAELGAALLQAGDATHAREHLRAAADAATTDGERAERLDGLASATLAIDGPAAAIDVVRAAITAAPQDRGPAHLRLEARLATLSSYLPEEIERGAERLRSFADLPGANRFERTLLAMLAHRGLYDVQPAAEVAALAVRALGDGATAGEAVDGLFSWGNAVNALTAADGVLAARSEVEHARDRVRRGGSPNEFAAISVVAAALSWRCGDVAGTDADADAALAALAFSDPDATVTALRAMATRLAVLAAIERGNLETAAAALNRFDDQCPQAPPLIAVTRLGTASAALALACGDPRRARDEAQQFGDHARARRLDTPYVPWRPPAAIALQRLHDEPAARRLADEHLALARRWGTPSDTGAALRLAARFDDARRLTLLEDAIATLQPAPGRLELARALNDYGAALRVARRRTDARAPLQRAMQLAQDCGAHALRAQAADGLAALGDQPRKLMFSGTDSLTASERRIAELAARGHSNRDIAHDLFVTPKTVENHLGRVYSKLGIRGRKQLTGALT